jgi:hypothetical protein
MQSQLYTKYQAENPEKFNEDLIYIRQKEDIDSYFRDLFSTLNSIPGITFLEMERINEENCGQYIPKTNISIEESRLDLIKAKFKIEWEGETKERELLLFIPKLVDDYFFVLNGNRYYAILQIADKNFYNVRNGVFLKTLLMPLGVMYKPMKIEAESGEEYTGKTFLLNFFKTKSNTLNSYKNFFIYFFIKYGFQETLKLMNLEDDVFVVGEEMEQDDDFEYFAVHKSLYLIVNKERMQSDENFKNLVVSLHSVLYDNIKKVTNLENGDFWRRKILTSTTAKLEKADKAILSLERILDERTKKNLRELPEGGKDSTFDVVRHMVWNYEELHQLDSLNIYTRRLRLYEYLIFPLLLKWSDITVRILNSRTIDMKRLETVFSNIGAMFLVKRLVTNELLRYSNITNSLNLFNVALKWSARGAQSLGANGGNVLVKYRSIHESFIGNLSLNASSSGDPGLAGSIVPFCTSVNDMFFEEKKTK